MERYLPILYWIFVIIGFVAVCWFIWNRQQRVEKFEGTTTSTTTTTPTVVKEYDPEEIVSELPRKSRLKLYLTSFSEPSTYQCQANYWCDALNPKTKFFLLSDSIPSSLTPSQGLPLKKVTIKGPPAYSLAEQNYMLGSFTIAFYAKINTLDTLDDPNNSKIIILDIPAQSPHRVQLYITPVEGNTTKANVSVTFGSECTLSSTTKTWEFDRSTLIGTVNTPTLFALVFDKESKKLMFYTGINATPENPRVADFETVPDVTLGVTEMTINKTRNWDANMVAMTYYSIPLTADELKVADKYLMQHSSGFTAMIRAKETLETEIKDLMSQLSTGEDTIRTLLEKLNNASGQCSDTKSQLLLEKLKKWQINMDGNVSVSSSDLGKCSILGIKSFGEDSKPKDTSAPMKEYPVSSPERYKVPYPPNVTAATPSSPISSATITNPSKPAPKTSTTPVSTPTSTKTTSTTTSAPSTPTGPVESKDSEFWQNFFGFLKDQENKNETMEKKTDLKSTYDKLRDEVTTDKTQPGSGTLLKATVQDPVKTTTTTTTEEKSGLWARIKDIFLA